MRCSTFRFAVLCALLWTSLIPVSAAPSVPPFRGEPEQVRLHVQSVGQSAARGNGEYLSPQTRTGKPFTHALVRYQAAVPDSATLDMFVRTSEDGATWTDWYALNKSDDLWSPADGADMHWSNPVSVGGSAQFWQLRGVSMPAADGTRPTLQQVVVDTVDARLSPVQQAAQQAAVSRNRAAVTRGTERPPVVSRTEWGNPDGQGSRATPAYYPVNHIVIHHTADANTLTGREQNWADRVRAEWSFHTLTRGWGDVGYNFLIDPDGVVYEGRAGGNDAVAFHDTANYGSMGVSVLGTYTTVTPTPASQQSLVKLLAWKAAQKRIDPLGASYYYGCAISKYCAPVTKTATIVNIAGHRQVTPGHTTCPGDAFMAILPRIRAEVANLVAGGSQAPVDNGDLQVDEFESGYTSSGDWHSAVCGAGGNTFWTYATDSAMSNSAIWRPTLPKTGAYRVYASVPQSCGLAAPPYATTRATYTIQTANGSVQRQVDQNIAEQWVDLGVYTFNQGQSGSVSLGDLAEPFSQRKIVFFDAIKWVAEDDASTNLVLTNVQFEDDTPNSTLEVASGGLLKVTFTIENRGATTAYTQEPQASLSADGSSFNDSNNAVGDAYVYDEGECFIGNTASSYAAFPKEANRFRVTLGPTSMSQLSDVSCAGATGNTTDGFHPWRWGLNGPLAAGQSRRIVGYVRFRNPTTSNRAVTLRAGIVQEYVRYFGTNIGETTVTVTPERTAPIVSELGDGMLTQAKVYELGPVPNNLLARTANPLSIPRGNYVGSFAWNGAFTDWKAGGPLGAGLVDNFLVEQVRAFYAPTAGTYTFRITSDDGSWLWIDGALAISNHGLHGSDEGITRELTLSQGMHVVGFKYFDRGGYAAAGYEVQMPGQDTFGALPDPTTGGALALGTNFFQNPALVLAADDLGGLGINRMRYSLNNGAWVDVNGALVEIPQLQNGSYILAYEAYDRLDRKTSGATQFTVDTSRSISKLFVPTIASSER